jgi:PAS domain S-box-containing protein
MERKPTKSTGRQTKRGRSQRRGVALRADGPAPADWLVGGGEMGDLIRSTDWTGTPLGPRERWPQSLRTVVNLVLESQFPTALLWGSELILLYNDAYRVIAAERHPRALGRSTREIWPEVWHINEPIFTAVLERGESVYLEDKLFPIDRRGQREDAYFTLCYSPVRVEDGHVAGSLVTLLETTRRVREHRTLDSERELAELAAQRERDRLAAVVASIPDEVWFADLEKQFTLANPAALREFALRSGNVVDVEAFAASLEVFRSDGSPRPVEEAPPLRALIGETITNQEEMIRTPATGELRWRQVNASPVRDAAGKIIGSVSIVRDITERKRVENAMAAAHRQIQSVIDNTPASVYAFDLEERFVMANSATAELLNSTPEQLIGKRRHEFMPREDADWHEENDRHVIKAGTALEFEEHSQLKGRSITWLTTKFPLRDAQGRISAVGGISTDITERKRAEEALQRANLQLAEADRRKNEFLAILSHELRNPLAPIANSLYILERAADGGEQSNRAKQVISRQVAHLSDLVNDLLDVTRISRNKIQLQKESLELNEVVRRAVEDNQSLFERAGIHLDLTPAPRPVRVIADRTRVVQVVGNLLQNAAKFTLQGGCARVAVDVEANRAVVRVADDGVGIATENLAGLFQPFIQADHTLDRSKGGLGLGLALVKGLVELHGGSVSAYSEGLGKGTEVVVRLPLDGGVALESEAARLHLPRPRRRILIIEDNIDAAHSLREALELSDHEVAIAHDGPEGLAKARVFQPEVVLCDIGLPRMDGFEVARAFRADERLKGAFLVALSGYALPKDLQRASEAGFARHLAKPPGMEALEELLASVPVSHGVRNPDGADGTSAASERGDP